MGFLKSKLPKAVIFDMDGLLLDSERLHQVCFETSMREMGFEPDLKIYRRCVGATGRQSSLILSKSYGSEFPVNQVKSRWSQLYRRMIQEGHLKLKPGAREVLEYLGMRGFLRALATSTSRELAEKKLSMLGLLECFDFSVTGDDVSQGKPNPEPYVKASAGLNVDAVVCWALEDSENGVRSAVGAGCQVIQIPDLIQPSEELRLLGHLVVESLDDVRDLLQTIEEH